MDGKVRLIQIKLIGKINKTLTRYRDMDANILKVCAPVLCNKYYVSGDGVHPAFSSKINGALISLKDIMNFP